uniref:CAZy families GT9 protein n=1 Tax=uncultured Arcobacter sp. TaxID=165434 RepID=A0A060C1M3_9BACT|nr:CAZy families GT9 protein [uncultured Arcobacter sp.]
MFTKARVLPKLDLNSLKALINKVDLVIGNDTGPTHMAWASNKAFNYTFWEYSRI